MAVIMNAVGVLAAKEGLLNVTVPLLSEPGSVSAHPMGVTDETNFSPAGKGSVTTVLAAGSGPLLFTLIVYVKLPFGFI
jgi:hypothetical protein